MTSPSRGLPDLPDLPVLDVLGHRPFAEVGHPVLAEPDEGRALLAVAGEPAFARWATVGVYGTGDLGCRAVLRARFPVHALAFHPTAPLLAVGTGRYDGGYLFEGELFLLDWETGAATSLIEDHFGRQVLGLSWLDEQALRVLMAPPDDWKDRKAHVDGHLAVVRRPDWRAVTPGSLTGTDLAGPRVPAPRPDGEAAARRALDALSPDREPRRHVLAVEEAPDGTVLATLAREEDDPEPPNRTAPSDGLRIRYGGRDRRTTGAPDRPLFPLSWVPGETHFPGPGAETADGDLVHAGTVHHGQGLQPGGSFVVRRAAGDGAPRWVFRTDHVATDLDLDTDRDAVHVAYRSGEILTLGLHDGGLRRRHRLTVAGVPAVPTALTVTRSGRLLVGTSDGRVLNCALT
ncbi:hypothetical protein GCM10009639_67480 [Kitasatospora putterlickiae]|uniref:Uncharacterized protein n=1 Tax=Kitasatospora putterlickiae TaxID=221725 RepID=A0ABP4J9Y0_9ACTN